jgi:peroxiredoxin
VGDVLTMPGVKGGGVLKEGEKAPSVIGTSYDGAAYDLGAPGRPTVLFFYPKAFTGG